MVVYCNNVEFRNKFIIPTVDRKEDADIEVYVLTESMSSLDLMKAFRACRINPMKAWYYIPMEPAEFHEYAHDAISRGTLNIYQDWDALVSAITEDAVRSSEMEIKACVEASIKNFGYRIGRYKIHDVSGAVLEAVDRYGAYPACKALLRLLESGREPNVVTYNIIMKDMVDMSVFVEHAIEEFRQTGSHVLGVMAADRIYKIRIANLEEFDRITIHVMFQPLTPDMHDLKDRRRQIVRVVQENGK